MLPHGDEVAALKQKHGEVWHVDFGAGDLIHRRPSQVEVDAYLLGTIRNGREEAANNLVFSARVWPGVEKLQAAFDEAPAVVGKVAETVVAVAGGDEDTILGLAPATLDTLTADDRAEVESRTGKRIVDLEETHPRGCLRWVRLPGLGVSIFRRPPRSTYSAFADASRGDEVMDACRTLCAESAITDQAALPGVFAAAPAASFYLAFGLAALAGTQLEVRSGKL